MSLNTKSKFWPLDKAHSQILSVALMHITMVAMGLCRRKATSAQTNSSALESPMGKPPKTKSFTHPFCGPLRAHQHSPPTVTLQPAFILLLCHKPLSLHCQLNHHGPAPQNLSGGCRSQQECWFLPSQGGGDHQPLWCQEILKNTSRSSPAAGSTLQAPRGPWRGCWWDPSMSGGSTELKGLSYQAQGFSHGGDSSPPEMACSDQTPDYLP